MNRRQSSLYEESNESFGMYHGITVLKHSEWNNYFDPCILDLQYYKIITISKNEIKYKLDVTIPVALNLYTYIVSLVRVPL